MKSEMWARAMSIAEAPVVTPAMWEGSAWPMPIVALKFAKMDNVVRFTAGMVRVLWGRQRWIAVATAAAARRVSLVLRMRPVRAVVASAVSVAPAIAATARRVEMRQIVTAEGPVSPAL